MILLEAETATSERVGISAERMLRIGATMQRLIDEGQLLRLLTYQVLVDSAA